MGSDGIILLHFAFDPVKAHCLFILKPARRQHLHAYANAHEGAGAMNNHLLQRFEDALVIKKSFVAGGESAVAW